MIWIFSLAASYGQESGQGFLNIANLIPAKEKVVITIMGKDLVPGGLSSIQSTGWFIVPSGSHSLSLACEGYKSASGAISIEDNISTLYVIYLEPNRKDKKDQEGKTLPPQIRIKRCPAIDIKKEHYLEVMSVCPDDETFQIGNKTMLLAPFTTQEIPGWRGGAFDVQYMKSEIGSCAGSQEKGSYFLLIGTDLSGKYSSLMVRNEKQELPPWIKEKKQPRKEDPTTTER